MSFACTSSVSCKMVSRGADVTYHTIVQTGLSPETHLSQRAHLHGCSGSRNDSAMGMMPTKIQLFSLQLINIFYDGFKRS